jgi:methylmalonyl-CoA/ethylmalonyl-CoA epimerase
MFKRIDHIGIAVRDITAAADMFERAYGLTVAVQEEIEDQQLIAALVPTGNVRFELMQPTTPDSVIGRYLERRGEGIHHVCFEVDDIRAEIETLKGRDVQLIQGAPREGFVGEVEFIHPRSARGVLTEIAQVTRRTETDTDLKLHHITIATSDRDEAADTWSKNFGLPVTRKSERANAPIATAWLDAGDAEVEFAQQTSETGPLAKAIESRGEGVYGIALETPDAPSLAEKVTAQGLRVIEDAEGDNVIRIVHPRDFLGTLVMFLQRPN